MLGAGERSGSLSGRYCFGLGLGVYRASVFRCPLLVTEYTDLVELYAPFKVDRIYIRV